MLFRNDKLWEVKMLGNVERTVLVKQRRKELQYYMYLGWIYGIYVGKSAISIHQSNLVRKFLCSWFRWLAHRVLSFRKTIILIALVHRDARHSFFRSFACIDFRLKYTIDDIRPSAIQFLVTRQVFSLYFSELFRNNYCAVCLIIPES
jgi:hypothetical protein